MAKVMPLGAGMALMLWERQRANVTASGSLVEQAGKTYAVVILLGFTTVCNRAAFVRAKSRGGFLALGGAAVLLFKIYLVPGRQRKKAVAVGRATALLALALAAWVDASGL